MKIYNLVLQRTSQLKYSKYLGQAFPHEEDRVRL